MSRARKAVEKRVGRNLALLHVTCVLGQADDALVSALAQLGKLDHVHIRDAQPERIPPAEARCAWQWRYGSKVDRDDAYDRMRETGLWCMKEDRRRRSAQKALKR